MAELSGTNLAGSIVPFTTEDKFATHLAKFGKGGWRSVADTAERDEITADRREAGMAVYVVAEKKLYILADDLTSWTELDTDSGYTKDEIDGLLAAIEAQIDANADAIQKTREDYIQADSDIMTIINAHAEQITTNKNDIDDLGDQVAEIETKIPESASETNQLVTQTDLTNKKIEIMGEVNESVSELQTQITAQAAAIADKVDKAGDTMTGTLNVPELNVATDEGTINLSITAGTATIATNNGLDIVAPTKFDTAPTTDDTTAWADVNATALVTKQQVTTALAGAGGGGSAEYPDQTDNAGKFLMTDGANVSWQPTIRNNTEITNALAIGSNATANGENAVVIGSNALSNSPQGANVVIGPDSKVEGYSYNSTAIGINTRVANYDATAIGRSSIARAQYSTVVGYNSQANTDYADDSDTVDLNPVLALGMSAYSRSNSTVAIGKNVYADGPYSVVMGYKSKVDQGCGNGIAIGQSAIVDSNSNYGISIGYNVKVKNSWSIAIGYNTQALSHDQVVIGPNAAAAKRYSVAIGHNATATGEESVQFGQGENTQDLTLQFREYTLVKQDGTIPPERLSPEPPAEGFTLVYDGQAGALRWAKSGSGSETAGTEVIIRRWN